MTPSLFRLTLTKLVFSGAATLCCLPSSVYMAKAQNPSPQSAEAKKPAGQTASPTGASEGRKTAESTPPVPATDPVITLNGLCSAGTAEPSGGSNSCKTVITRDQFERLVAAFNLSGDPMRPDTRRNFAKTYAELLTLEDAARKANLDNTEQFEEIMRWLRLRAAAGLYRRGLEEKYGTPSQQEIDAYYKEHLPSYERITAARILVPRAGPAGADKAEFDQKARDTATAARDRAVKGEDPEQIQKDCYAALGLGNAPPTDIGTRGRNQFLPEESGELFALKVGDVSKLEIEAASYVVYKVASKETVPQDRIKREITAEISRRNLAEAIRAATENVHPEFNEQYFGVDRAMPAGASAAPIPGTAGAAHP
jgi:hypothetical protein